MARKRRRKTPIKYIIRRIGCLTVLACIVAVISLYAYCSRHDDMAISESNVQQNVRPRDFAVSDTVKFNGQYKTTFDDIQEVQIVAAQNNGISPLSSNAQIDSVVGLGLLVRVNNDSLYETEKVEHPYLIPDALALLDVIARRYQAMGHQGQLRVTGCLRTDEYISKLMRGNRNSVKNSCHLYGTTFDISYRYLSDREKRDLGQILYQLQQAGHCYVKYELKQPCFHITLR